MNYERFSVNFVDMSKILVIGVGGAGRETVKHMKDNGIPEADYITFGDFGGDDDRENVEDDIQEILEYHLNESNNGEQ